MAGEVPNVMEASIAAGAATSGIIEMREMVFGILKNDGSNWTAADIVFDVCEKRDGTYTTLKDCDGTVISVTGLATNAPHCRRLPLEVSGAHYVKLRSVTAGTVTSANQTNAQTITIQMK